MRSGGVGKLDYSNMNDTNRMLHVLRFPSDK